jgi:hypothetical protein
MLTGSTTLRTCVHLAIENMGEIKMHGIALIKIDFYIQWECAKLAILVIIIR